MPHERSRTLYPRVRLEALTDGIYSVAMTLLVLDVRLPDNFNPGNAAALSQGLIALWPKLFPYLLSFGVLGVRWLSSIQVRSGAEHLDGAYIRWWMFGLLLTTGVPFTTIVVGRFGELAPAAWLYAGNMALLAIASWRQLAQTTEVTDEHRLKSRRDSSLVMLASSLACIAWSFFDPSNALWAFVLNLTSPLLVRWRNRHAGGTTGNG